MRVTLQIDALAQYHIGASLASKATTRLGQWDPIIHRGAANLSGATCVSESVQQQRDAQLLVGAALRAGAVLAEINKVSILTPATPT